MRRVNAVLDPAAAPIVHQVVGLDALAAEWVPDLNFLVPTDQHGGAKRRVLDMRAAGLPNVAWAQGGDLEEGDVVVPDAQKGRLHILFRASDSHHALLLTNQCNSHCLMCSQPPTKPADRWLVDEALAVVRHIKVSPFALGLSGGEPLLLGTDLRRLLDALAERHPSTWVEVLSNGRLLGDAALAAAVLDGLGAKVRWLVPLYGHAGFLHDFVVQAPGAFEETIAGLLALQRRGLGIQLRIVLIAPVLQNLVELCGFIGRNLPFVGEVALMACEPTGFALANRELCELDLADWEETLCNASRVLDRHGVPHLFMNAPLCALPRQLWRFAHKSISDWKNTYAEECGGCVVKERCSGLFAWHESGWPPTKIRAILGVNP